MKIIHPKSFYFCLVLLYIVSTELSAQLGFCGGSSGDPIFTENFGSGTVDGPALPPGTTSYNFTTGTPTDGDYIISSTTNYFDWFSIQDHTLDDTNGKSLIVNASFTAGEFYQREVSELCENTSYEFSSWIINLLPQNNGCITPEIPINVRFQIWDETDTNLLAQGDTGSIASSVNPVWEQYALVFKTEPGQTSVILKMRNNESGGCGNDLAIDDIVFKSCGDNVVVSTGANENDLIVCEDQGAVSRTIVATPDNSIFSIHAYQWQQSTDQQLWTDIANETSNTLSTPPITTTTYFRVKIAEDPINVNNDLCNVVSDVFEIIVLPIPNAPTSNGDVTVCEGQIGVLSASAESSYAISWYDAPTEGNLLLEGNNNFETAIGGTYYAEANAPEIECASLSRTPITLSINLPPIVQDESLTFCEETTITLTADLDNVSYNWSNGATTKETTVNESGIYTVVITDMNGCSALKTIELEQIDVPRFDNIISDGPSIIVSTINTGDFEFSLDGFNFQDSPIFEAVESGLYTIYVQDKSDCGVFTQSFFHLVIPKFFTPNGDNINDIFEPEGLEIFSTISFSIFDRYGKLLKSENTDSASWDGSFQGKDMPEDDYWYNIRADTTQFKGHFSLKR